MICRICKVNFERCLLAWYHFFTYIPQNGLYVMPKRRKLQTNLMQPAFQYKSSILRLTLINEYDRPINLTGIAVTGQHVFFSWSCLVVLMKTFNIFLKVQIYWTES